MAHEIAIEAALAVMQSHIDALNARDEARIAATLHFPHNRLSGIDLKCWETADSYFADFKARAGGDWARSRFDDIRVVQASENKVHLDVLVKRFAADGGLMIAFSSLWVVSRIDGNWAAQLRSSFAPDAWIIAGETMT